MAYSHNRLNQETKKNTVLKHLKEILNAEKEKLEQWINLGKKIEESVCKGEEKKLHEYRTLEEYYCREIASYEKVFLPLKDLYREYCKDNADMKAIKTRIEELKEEVLIRNKKNKELLKEKLASIETELTSIAKRKRGRPGSRKTSGPSYIDISV